MVSNFEEGEKMKWLAQLENFAAGKPLGECPVCGSEKLEAAFTKVQGDMGFGDIWCDNCHHAFHLSRIRITKEMPTGIKAPGTLVYGD